MQNCVPVCPGKTGCGRFAPGQPAPSPVLAGRKAYGQRIGNGQRIDVFDVVRDAGGIAIPPFGEDFKSVGEAPVFNLAMRGAYARFFFDFAPRRFDERLPFFLTAGDRLPIPRMFGAFKQQDIQRRRVNDDKDGNRAFV